MQKRIADYPVLYSGSVKNVRTYDSEHLLFEFTDQVSVFDWGALPDLIKGKGLALADIGSCFFETLAKPSTWHEWSQTIGCASWMFQEPDFVKEIEKLKNEGLPSHFRGVLEDDGKKALLVEKVGVIRPSFFSVDGVQIPQYVKTRNLGELIPLEVVFRHEIVSGSSVLKRDSSLKIGDRFEKPRIEFYSKLESQDRFLATSEAFSISGLTSEKFLELQRKTILCSLFLKTFFEKLDIRLIDGKFEWALGKNGEVILVDSIGSDELRLLKHGKDLSKESLREFYRETPWYLELVKEKAKGTSDWKRQVKHTPPSIPVEVAKAVSVNYIALADDVKKTTQAGVTAEKILLVGSGAREHALAQQILKSNRVSHLVWATHNEAALMQLRNTFSNKIITPWTDPHPEEYLEFSKRAKDEGVTLAVIGPDQPLADGIADHLENAGVSTFGPKKGAARLEWSKSFSKQVMKAARIPTASSFEIQSKDALIQKLNSLEWSRPWVLKADGLALGKGVVVCFSLKEGLAAVEALAKYGDLFVLEEFLSGSEVSLFALSDGDSCSYLGSAKDYKTLLEGHLGPNTGGMGAVSPAPGMSRAFEEKVFQEVFVPVVREMKKRGTPYVGVLYAGLMVKGDQYWVLEFNSRFGDPEAQVLLPRLNEDLVVWMNACADRTLENLPRTVGMTPSRKVYVVAASEGYPENPKKGVPILGLEPCASACSSLFFSGIQWREEKWATSGGRVLGALGSSKSEAYCQLKKIIFQGMHFRRDIGGKTPRVIILASGRGSNFDAIADAQLTGGLDAKILALGCNRKDAAVFEKAKARGIETFLIQNESDIEKRIQMDSPDAVILAGYDRVLSANLIQCMRDSKGRSRIINIHPSLLPAFKGLHSYEKAFQAKVKVSGVTVHRVEPDLDSGPILAQETFSIEDCSSSQEVEKLGLAIEHRLYPKTLQTLFSEENDVL